MAGDQRGPRKTVVAVTLALLVLAGVGYVLLRPGTGLPPDETYSRLSRLGSVAMPLGQRGSGTVRVVDDRAYLVGLADTDGHLRLGALDLTSGGSPWKTVDLGPAVAPFAFFVGADVIAVGQITQMGPNQLRAFDPATGAELWNQYYYGQFIGWYDSTVVLGDPHSLRGLDRRTGEQRWMAQLPGGRAMQSLSQTGTAGALLTDPNGVDPGAHQVYDVGGDGSVRVYDTLTGSLVRTATDAVIPGTDRVRIFDGVVYSTGPALGGTAYAYDFAGAGRRVALYRGGPDDTVDAAQPCGAGTVCVPVHHDNGGTEVIGIDRVSGSNLWQYPQARFTDLATIGTWTLSDVGYAFANSGHGYSASFGRWVGWLTESSYIAIGQNIGGSTDTTISLESVSTDTYRSTTLAELRGATLVGQCGLTRTALVCPFSAGFQAYRLPTDI
jgi:hypothetical protein